MSSTDSDMRAFEVLLIAGILMTAAFMAGRYTCNSALPIMTRRDTIVIRDTVRDTVPVARWRTKVRIDTCYLTRVDTIAVHDTVRVAVPIEQVEYRTDRYCAIVEGWRPRLLSIDIYDERYVVIEKRQRAARRWGVTIGGQAGYGITPQGFLPYIGIGASFGYRF